MPTATKKAATRKAAAPKAVKSTVPTEKEITTVSETETPATDATENLMQQARSAALARVRDEHRERYNAILVEEAAARGIEWAPKPSPKERAAAKLRALVEEYPELKDELTS